MSSNSSSSNESCNDEVMRKCLKPNPTDDQLLTAIRSTYNITDVSIVKSLESYDDRNWLVRLGSKKCLAKVYNGVESAKFIQASAKLDTSNNDDETSIALSSIHLYNDIFQHLNQPKYGVKTSLPIPLPSSSSSSSSKTSSLIVSIHSLPVTSKSHSPSRLALLLLDWVEGETMASVETLSIETIAEAGQYLGKVCKALDDLTSENHQARKTAERYHAWDGRNTLDLKGFVNCITNVKRRGLVESVMNSFSEELGEAEFRKGILQADFNDANIIVDDDGKVCGVIDFGDTTYSWRVLDITVAMAYSMITKYGKTGHSIAAAAAILRGFHSVYPLEPKERKYLRLLTACRLSCSVTLGAYSYQQNPQNEYLLFHAEPAWKSLELLLGSDDKNDDVSGAIDGIFNIACDACTSVSDDTDTDGELPILDCKDIALSDSYILGKDASSNQ